MSSCFHIIAAHLDFVTVPEMGPSLGKDISGVQLIGMRYTGCEHPRYESLGHIPCADQGDPFAQQHGAIIPIASPTFNLHLADGTGTWVHWYKDWHGSSTCHAGGQDENRNLSLGTPACLLGRH